MRAFMCPADNIQQRNVPTFLCCNAESPALAHCPPTLSTPAVCRVGHWFRDSNTVAVRPFFQVFQGVQLLSSFWKIDSLIPSPCKSRHVLGEDTEPHNAPNMIILFREKKKCCIYRIHMFDKKHCMSLHETVHLYAFNTHRMAQILLFHGWYANQP